MTVTAELMARFLAAAVRFSGLPAIDLAELPPIEPVTAAVLAGKVCPDAPDRCNSVAALFDTERYRIYLRDSLNPSDPMDNSFIVHELVHVLQFRKFGHEHFNTCRKVLDSEQQAYYVQNNYLGEEGIDWREGFLLRFMKCPPEEAVKDELGRDNY
jgi:hypothetical protein